jgi:hypothetical protein
MADMDVEAIAALRKKRQFKKFMFRGIELDKLLDLSHEVIEKKSTLVFCTTTYKQESVDF